MIQSINYSKSNNYGKSKYPFSHFDNLERLLTRELVRKVYRLNEQISESYQFTGVLYNEIQEEIGRVILIQEQVKRINQFRLTKRREYINSERIIQELESENFKRGLEKAIQITHKNGRETSFYISKVLYDDRIMYPDHIWIGSPNEAYQGPHLNPRLAIKEGVKFRTSPELIGAYIDKIHLGLECVKDFGEFILEDYDSWRSWVKSKDVDPDNFFTKYPQIENDILVNENRCNDQSYELFHFHTHPWEFFFESNYRPSLDDLENYNFLRRFYSKQLKLDLRPIFIITGLSLLNNHRIILYQEKTNTPLTKDIIKYVNYNTFYGRGRICPDFLIDEMSKYYSVHIAKFSTKKLKWDWNYYKKFDPSIFQINAEEK